MTELDQFIALAEDRDALLRVARLAADGTGADEVFDAVAGETSRLTGYASTAVVRFDGERSYTVVGTCASTAPVGTRVEIAADDEGLVAAVRRTGRSARMEDHGGRGALASARNDFLAFSSVAVPITVDDHLWGVLSVTTGGAGIPDDVELRLDQFAVLVSVVVANADARAELETLADERAWLRRIHAVAGRGGTGAEVLAAIAAEGSAWLGGAVAVLMRLEDDGSAVVLASSHSGPSSAGSDRVPDDRLVAEVRRSGRPGRVDDYSARTRGSLASQYDLAAAVAVPVTVNARIWGVLIAGSPVGPMPPQAEPRLARFTDSITPTILSAQARTQLAEEQRALRRVAEVVARGAEGEEVFSTVVSQASVLARDAAVALAKWEGTDHVRIIAAHGADAPSVGTRVGLDRRALTGLLAAGEGAAARAAVGDADGRERSLAAWIGRPGSVVVPVRLAGELWGVLGASSAAGPLPAVTEHRLHQFADLVAAALAHAQARAEIQSLADEQAALRRVAELAARDAPSAEVLAAVALEASALTGVEFTTLLRYDPDGCTEVVALHGAPDGFALGMRASGDGDGAIPRVWRTGRAARIDDVATMSGHWARAVSGAGFTSTAAVPIKIHGALWGVLVTVGRRELVSASNEEHLTSFAELAGTAISSAQARRELRVLVAEQAALGRVADLVVRGAALDDVFSAVAVEASGLLGGIAAGLWQRKTDDSFALVANVNCKVPVGLCVPPHPGTPFADLLKTGAPARIESFERTPLASVVEQMQVGPTVAVPITVEGRLWGAFTVSTWQAPLPADIERRLLKFTELAGAAIASAENKAKLTTSRARVVATADETRRRLQRDVHDSAQQRLVHTIIALKLARDAIANGTPSNALVDEALVNAERASRDLSDVVRGILPVALTRGGLRTGLESLLLDLVLPVDLSVTAPRCSAHTELTAYFTVAEALTNVVKHAQASRAAVSVSLDGDTLAVEVRDDGIGGADPGRGTGLLGLVDRVDAAGGALTLISPPDEGTTLLVHLPLHQPMHQDARE